MANKNPLGTFGPLWMGAALIILIVSAFFHGPREFISGLNIYTHMLLFWAVMAPGVAMCLVAAKKP
jgi:hypothetical protein